MITKFKQFEAKNRTKNPMDEMKRRVIILKSMVDMESPYYILRPYNNNNGFSLDIGYFTDQNLGGFGKGIRGDYFYTIEGLKNALSGGDELGRCVFKIGDEEELLKLIYRNGWYSDMVEGQSGYEYLVEKIVKERKGYASADPDGDREIGVYFEISELCGFLGIENKYPEV